MVTENDVRVLIRLSFAFIPKIFNGVASFDFLVWTMLNCLTTILNGCWVCFSIVDPTIFFYKKIKLNVDCKSFVKRSLN